MNLTQKKNRDKLFYNSGQFYVLKEKDVAIVSFSINKQTKLRTKKKNNDLVHLEDLGFNLCILYTIL